MEYIDAVMEEKEEVQKEMKKLLKNRKFRKNLISIILVASLILVSVGAAWMAGVNRSKEEIKSLEEMIKQLEDYIAKIVDNPMVVDDVSPVISLDMINNEIQEIGELATVEYLFTNAAKFTDSKQIKNWKIPLTEKSFTIKWDGVIKAGVKVNQIGVDLNEAEKKIIITIPAAEILSYDTDENSIEILDESDNKFNPITVGDKVKFDAETEKEMKDRAIDNGILEKAQKSAEKIIRSILISNPVIEENYTIEFICK